MVPAHIARSPYVSLVTYRRDGTPVATAVWAAVDGDGLVVWTGAGSGKTKRLGRDPRVTVAPCDLRGRVAPGEGEVRGTGQVVAGPADMARVCAALDRKYGWRFRWVRRVHRWFLPRHVPHVGVLIRF
ncbi:PPOX class F420-dependent oxidoreductase [Streptomyces sp. B1866]|uniref:PPOX class F420-dependent oxidoreductase n=1 Tax=Streptomyces sp. B1866 TaxID=3075431 RepID=UPI00288EF990|nr:PPOX class F420-dependent oxidoreductase [Streptomyces sp. B1866]MDT3399497.1 PPOX class F420-dependent oxidoreductase [Streptomyces sp. B1866]